MEIVFVRHAEPEWVKDRLNVDNPPLTVRGFEQAELLGNWAASEHFDEVYVSPLVRTQQTAAPILAALKMDLVIAPWLEEIRNPIWHGTPEEKAIEAYKSEKAKTSAFREGIRILLVAHAGTSSVSICHMLGFPPTPWEWERLVIGHATVNRLEVFEIGDGMTFGLSQLSGHEHLPKELRTY